MGEGAPEGMTRMGWTFRLRDFGLNEGMNQSSSSSSG